MAPSTVEIPVIIPKSFSTPTASAPEIKIEDLKGPESPLPEVKKFNAGSCTVEEVVSALRVAGGVVVRGLLNADEISKLEADTRPYLDSDEAWGEGGGEGES